MVVVVSCFGVVKHLSLSFFTMLPPCKTVSIHNTSGPQTSREIPYIFLLPSLSFVQILQHICLKTGKTSFSATKKEISSNISYKGISNVKAAVLAAVPYHISY
jgi:hypothetical protein